MQRKGAIQIKKGKRCFLVILDGVGVGELPDAWSYNDEGSATLQHVAEAAGGLPLPNLQRCGIGNIVPIHSIPPIEAPVASFGKLTERSAGKDSTTGHWEIAGLITKKPFPLYPDGFPDKILDRFIEKTGCGGILGNKPASGTAVINELGDEHLRTGMPIVYTSADPVFQIAVHEEKIPIETLYRWCEIARHEVMTGDHAVSRVIARPFTGTSGAYARTGNRKDFSLEPPEKTILDHLTDAGIRTVSIGKVDDLFAGKGIAKAYHTKSNEEGIQRLLEQIQSLDEGFVFMNLVDFDQQFGHRNDVAGFAEALRQFDRALPALLGALKDTDLFIMTSDHGNDPTTASTDHSREYAFLLAYSGMVKRGVDLGTRETFADIAQTCAEYFELPKQVKDAMAGTGFFNELRSN